MAEIKKLVNAKDLIKQLWEPGSRPSLRWVRYMTQRKAIPSTRCGRLIFYDAEAVRRSLLK